MYFKDVMVKSMILLRVSLFLAVPFLYPLLRKPWGHFLQRQPRFCYNVIFAYKVLLSSLQILSVS